MIIMVPDVFPDFMIDILVFLEKPTPLNFHKYTSFMCTQRKRTAKTWTHDSQNYSNFCYSFLFHDMEIHTTVSRARITV